MANYYSYNTNQVQADINMDNAIKDIQNQLLNIPTDSQLGLKANQTDLDTTNANVAANTSSLADMATLQVNLESFKLQTPETDDTARINRAIDSISSTGGVIEFANKTYNVSGSLHVYNNVKLKGSSRGGTVINYSGSSYLITVTGVLNFYIQDIKFSGSNTGKIIQLNNVFKCSIKDVQFANCSVAIEFANNAGDNTVSNCLFTDNGVALSVQSAVNYVSNCMFSGNILSIQIGTQNVATYAGIRVSLCTFVTNALNPFPQYAIKDWGQTGMTVIDKCWFEGFLIAIEVGDGSNGAYSFTVRDGRVSATSKCINLVNGSRFDLDNVTFQADNSVNQPNPYANAIPDEITVGSSAESGVIINPVSLITGKSFNPTMTGLAKTGWVVLNNRLNPAQMTNGIDMANSTITRLNQATYNTRGSAFTPSVGTVAYANGTSWNPGSGEGLYIYKSTGWTLLG